MNRSIPDTAVAGSATPHDAGANAEPDEQPAQRPAEVTPDSEVGEEDPGAAVDQPAVEPIYPPGSHGHQARAAAIGDQAARGIRRSMSPTVSATVT